MKTTTSQMAKPTKPTTILKVGDKITTLLGPAEVTAIELAMAEYETAELEPPVVWAKTESSAEPVRVCLCEVGSETNRGLAPFLRSEFERLWGAGSSSGASIGFAKKLAANASTFYQQITNPKEMVKFLTVVTSTWLSCVSAVGVSLTVTAGQLGPGDLVIAIGDSIPNGGIFVCKITQSNGDYLIDGVAVSPGDSMRLLPRPVKLRIPSDSLIQILVASENDADGRKLEPYLSEYAESLVG